MPDLSNLLGAVYGDGPSTPSRDPEDDAHVEREPAADERGPAVPDWAGDDHLDAAFAQWKPGPTDDAAPAEHAFVHDAADDPAPPLADDLAAALSEALVAASGTGDDPAADKPHFDFSVTADDEDESQDLSKFEVESDEHAQTTQVHELGEVVEPEHAEWEPAPDLEHAPELENEHVAESHAEPEPEHAWVPQTEPEPEHAWVPQGEPEHASVPEAEPEPEAEWEPEHADELAGEEPVADYEAPDAEHDVEPEAEQDEPEVDNWPTSTHRRAAAAELTAANRPDPEPFAPAQAPTPVAEPEPVVANAPVASAPEPVRAYAPLAGDGAEAPTTLPAGMRRWDRSDDDILPEKSGKKFFSLRRG